MAKKLNKLDERYLQHSPELRNFIAKHVKNTATVEELVQEVFLKIYKSAKRNSIEKPRAYLFKIARHLLIDHHRKSVTRQRDNMLEFDEAIHTDTHLSEEKRIEARDDLRCLAIAIQQLPPRTRKAFTLSRLYKYSYSEVAKMMDISPRTVEGHVAKGLAICTEYMTNLETTETSNNVIKLTPSSQL